MDPLISSHFNAGWASHAQQLAINSQHDGRALGAMIWRSLVTADDGMEMAGLNLAARTPTTIEHPLYAGVAK